MTPSPLLLGSSLSYRFVALPVTFRECTRSSGWDDLVKTVKEAKQGNPKQYGRYFENATRRLFGLPKYSGNLFNSAERQEARLGKLGYEKGDTFPVVPDAVSYVMQITGFDPLGGRTGKREIRDHYMFFDAKRGKSILRLSSYDYEAVGYADVLSTNAKRKPLAGVRPVMTYIITTDITIDKAVIAKFEDKVVHLVQIYMRYDDKTCEVFLGDYQKLTHHGGKDILGTNFPRTRRKVDWGLIKPGAGD